MNRLRNAINILAVWSVVFTYCVVFWYVIFRSLAH
jgi:hypothetical protein